MTMGIESPRSFPASVQRRLARLTAGGNALALLSAALAARTSFWVAIFVGIASSSVAIAGDSFVQDQEQFTRSIDNYSTAPSFVLITVINANTGATWTGCTPAPFLFGAICIEKGLLHSPDCRAVARKFALSIPSHVYEFSNPEALKNLPIEREDWRFRFACGLIRGGRPAFMTDISGEIKAGFPHD